MLNKKITILITVILVLSIILRLGYVVEHINHKCNHDNCPICNIIKSFENDIKNILPNTNKIIVVIIPIILLNYIKIIKYYYNNYSLILLKVRLNN